MPDVVDAALEHQRRNIETRTRRSFEEWLALARASGHETPWRSRLRPAGRSMRVGRRPASLPRGSGYTRQLGRRLTGVGRASRVSG